VQILLGVLQGAIVAHDHTNPKRQRGRKAFPALALRVIARPAMFPSEPTVFVIASGAKAQRALAGRIKAMGVRVHACSSVNEALDAESSGRLACAVLRLGDPIADLAVLRQLRAERARLPVVVVSAHAEVPLAVRAMKLGAMDYLEESETDEALAEAVHEALCWSAENREHLTRIATIGRRLKKLDPGHRQVLDLLMDGRSNREIAAELDLSVRGIEGRRAKIMRTMRAKSLAELVRMTVMGAGRPSATGTRQGPPATPRTPSPEAATASTARPSKAR
jgi:two-component system, LuxR family, response regulator FixJ